MESLSLAKKIWRQKWEICSFILEISIAIIRGISKRLKRQVSKIRIPLTRNHRVINFHPTDTSRLTNGFKFISRKISSFKSYRYSKTLLAGALGLILIGSGFGFWILTGPRVVLANGTPLAVAKSKAAYKNAVEKAIEIKSSQVGGMSVEVTDQVALKFRLTGKVDSDEDLVQILSSNLNFASMGTAIVVNGQPRIVVATADAANTVLDKLKARYNNLYPSGGVTSTGFAEEVSLAQIKATPAEVLTPDQALEKILAGEQQPASYKIKEGDSPWTIAHKNNMDVNDLLAANPGLDEERLQIGQEIKLSKSASLINVIATLETKARQEVAFDVEVKPDDQKDKSYKKVVQPGTLGLKEVNMNVIYRNGQPVDEKTLDETVIQEPQKQIEIRGTRTMLASRGGGVEVGNGKLSWPARGPITSPYGPRSRGFHTGLDIGAGYGQPIGAAESGTVIEAQWGGGYGREIVIDHGGGLLTRYAHCSALNVKKGAKVSRGDIIGNVGASGNATGPHLHFEVIVNGSTINPMKYLS